MPFLNPLLTKKAEMYNYTSDNIIYVIGINQSMKWASQIIFMVFISIIYNKSLFT